MFDFLTCQLEENLPLTVPVSHLCCQVTDVAATVSARHVGQADVVGVSQQDRLGLKVGAIVPVGHSVGQISSQDATEMTLRVLADL